MEHTQTEADLQKRIKELNCFYGISTIIEKDLPMEDILQKVVNLLPDVWQYPEIACARILFDDNIYQTDNFQETSWKQSSSIIVNKAQVGAVEVFYLENRPETDEGPFLKKERSLIDAVSKRMGHVSEHKKTEQKLVESEENLQITFNSIGDAVLATDTDAMITRMNPIAEKLTGWNLSEAKGKPLQDVFNIVNATSLETAEDPVEKALKLGTIVGLANHTVLISKDGTEYQIADSCAPIHNYEGNIIGTVLVFRDMSKEYQMKSMLQDTKKKYFGLLSNLDVGVVVHAADTSIIISNPKASKILGLTDQQMKGKQAIDPEWKFLSENKTPLPLGEYPVNQIVATKKAINDLLLGVIRPRTNDLVWVNVNG
ncbi:MAG: PAS domain-containing protein, partial [Methanosarcinaceae archaeon]